MYALKSITLYSVFFLAKPFIQACQFHETSSVSYSDRSLVSAITELHEYRNKRTTSFTPKRKIANNVRVFDGYMLQPFRTVVIDGSVIGENAEGAEQLDGEGGVLLPGFMDTHAHSSNITDLHELSRFGVTTVMSAACFVPELCNSLRSNTGLVDVLIGSLPATAPGSAHGNITVRVDGNGDRLVHNRSEVAQWVICHAATHDAYQQAVSALVDDIHHAPLDSAITTEMVKCILRNKQTITPTLSMMQATVNAAPTKYNYTAAQETVRALHKAGIPILAGTDANMQTGVPAMVPFGKSIHQELELLVETGLSPIEALRAATSSPAKYWGLRDRGLIAPGKRADLLLVSGDPTEDVRATRNLKRVWLAGEEFSSPLGTF